jgi:hypothetical protein
VGQLISAEQKTLFKKDGYLIIKGFFDVESEILPIQKSIYDIIGKVALRHGITLERPSFDPESFDKGYNTLLKLDRSYASEIYDLAKQIPSFLRLISNQRSDDLFCEIRETQHSGIGAGSYGIRIDNPSEDKFRSHWHQEFLWQPQSMDGVVFWTPLLPVTEDMGPVIVLPKSHQDGLCKYSKGQAYAQKVGAYKIGIFQEDKVVSNYEQIAPLLEPGDLLLMDFLTIHGSGVNRADRSRWSIQNRFFNFEEPVGTKIGWKASITGDTQVEMLFPDNFIEE